MTGPSPPGLAILGGAPVRAAFPEPRPRLRAREAAGIARALRAREWSRTADDAPLPGLDLLEARWAELHGARFAVAVSSGTAGLELVLRSLRIPAGDEVLVPAYGCPAVDVAVLRAGLTPVHVEIDPESYCMAPAAAAAAVTARCAAMVAVHFAGQPAGIPELARLAARRGLALVEDACLAPGSACEGRPAGAWGVAAVFSLGVRKPVSAGEGGMVTTGDPGLAASLRRARSLGADPESGDIVSPTGTFRLTELQAAAALPQLERLEKDRGRRERAARRLAAALGTGPALRPLARDPRVSRHAWAQFWLRCDEEAAGVTRGRIAEAVQAEGIPLFCGWPLPNHCLAFYAPARAAAWLRARDSGRSGEHYALACFPHAERAAFSEALVLDFPILDAGSAVVRDAARALARVAERLHELAGGG